jgi:predicted N-acyltransferase
MFQARFHACLHAIDASAWNALLPNDNPFVTHAFLAGLEDTGCIRADYGWQAHHLGLYEGEALVAAAPLYLKGNSHGEYVFDWAWADAYERHGLSYYPKLLCGVPYSPVPGPRLLAGTGPDAPCLRSALITAIEAETRRLGLSSAHVNFALDDEASSLAACGWLERSDWQFHWHNRGWTDFEQFLGALSHKKRKNIRAERNAVARAGITCSMRGGASLDAPDWTQIHTLYRHTFEDKGNHAALTAEFFGQLGANLGDRVQVAIAHQGESDPILAMALFLRGADTLYGRYWGARTHVPGLHFELCYYQGIDYCVRGRLAHFEPGAQGQHKIARGFSPTRTRSFHHIADPRFRAAIDAALEEEARAIDNYGEVLRAHSPYARIR